MWGTTLRTRLYARRYPESPGVLRIVRSLSVNRDATVLPSWLRHAAQEQLKGASDAAQQRLHAADTRWGMASELEKVRHSCHAVSSEATRILILRPESVPSGRDMLEGT